MNRDRRPAASPDKDGFLYEPVERFGESMTSPKPWNKAALAGVELLNGRMAMLGFAAAIVGELLTGKGMVGQLAAMLHWYLG
ncbi:high light inducible protein [Cyanobium sp. A1C-AMD]|uniref:chlorophyll a/b-binding protein n=1 Tax=Cyanobium sp. A1C-AMD TaxID=2823694 RepID=UPI0020CD74E3|nr:chlorophyll a/b-binding protein [Cyanobium sp. A1C-AMD]MCP9878619.1 high light inducible protein [Cyanobium sp. A1C-AMD]